MTPKEMMEKARAIHTLNVASAQNVSANGNPNDAIRVMMYFPGWAIGQEYVAGHTVMWAGAPVVCVTGHSTALHPDWTPDSYAAGWKPWHATEPEYALPYLMLHSTYKYMAGEYCAWEDGQVYQCLVDNTVHSPGELPGSWEVWVTEPAEVVVEPPENEAIEIEPDVLPWISGEAVDIGDRREWAGTVYEVYAPAGVNIWTPDSVPAIWRVVV